jgi:hypothetical protein
MRRLAPLFLLLLAGCYDATDWFGGDEPSAINDDDDDDDTSPANDDDSAPGDDDDSGPGDGDGDGYAADADCDDGDPAVHPDAPELCNGADDDCDGDVDEGITVPWYPDGDGDGFGITELPVSACEPPAGHTTFAGDCDDTDPAVHPGSAQQLDGVDSDCDGRRDWLLSAYISGDDDFEWCLDDENTMVPGDTNWPAGQLFEVWVTSGVHVIGIQGWDLGQVITAVIGHFELSDGTRWVTDGDWTFDPNPDADPSLRGGWCSAGFDDSAWQLANVIGPIGTSPWGNAPSVFPAGSPAMWIWDYFPVDLNTQYLRQQIEVP